MLTFAAIVPHPAISIPEIGKANVEKIHQTIEAIKNIKLELYASQPDTLIIISSHTADVDDVFSINQNKELKINFKKFGDLEERFNLKNNIGLGYRIREGVEANIPLILTENDQLDYATAIPLWHLLNEKRNIKVVIIGSAPKLPLINHFEFGQSIIKQIDNNSERIAVLASADLSHEETAGEVTQEYLKFDKQLLSAIEDRQFKDVASLNQTADDFQAGAGLRSIAILLGIISNKRYKAKTLSYENPLGVGYATMLISLD